ncbi:restriction endonuclease [Polaribacter sp. Asnod6-C07]|uniref:restriction endonuclease n=1 Tax=Polaribacter sp. Asnod6-C07 TaxID=3160582 RepID=UPI00386EFC56
MNILNKPRIAIFDEWVPFQMGQEIIEPNTDDPIDWIEFINKPNFESNGHPTAKEYRLKDERAIKEIHRLIKYNTCPICKSKMQNEDPKDQQTILVCLKCGFWGGRGSRFDRILHESIPSRGVLGFYKPFKPLKEIDSEFLITHLKRHPKDLPKIGPKRAEKFVLELLSESLNCEVKPVGGIKDGGVDGYIIKNDEIETIIQVKWRQDMNKAESVGVVREVAGTLLARGVPSGILISNRNHFSKDAKFDASEVSKRKIEKLGQMNLTLLDYHNIIDMLDISNTRLTDKMTLEDWYKPDSNHVFDGAVRISENFVNMFK